MFILDTNHFRELVIFSDLGRSLRQRMESASDSVVTSIVTAEEAFRGWLARLAATPDSEKHVVPYQQLSRAITCLASCTVIGWDKDCAMRFNKLRQEGIRIGTMDLKIACIALEYDAVVLKRNTVDFAKVPALRFENWLD